MTIKKLSHDARIMRSLKCVKIRLKVACVKIVFWVPSETKKVHYAITMKRFKCAPMFFVVVKNSLTITRNNFFNRELVISRFVPWCAIFFNLSKELYRGIAIKCLTKEFWTKAIWFFFLSEKHSQTLNVFNSVEC